MIIQENIRLLLINEDPFYKETEYQNPNGIRITIPARSVMFSDYNDDNGYPVYEFASLDYVRPEHKGEGLYDLVSTPLLDERNASKREDTSDKQARVFHMVIKRRNSITGEIFPYVFSESSIRERLDSDRVSYQYGMATHNCDLYLKEDENEEIRVLTNRFRASGSTDEGGLDDYLRLHRRIFAGNQKPIHIHMVIRNESTDNRGNHNNMRLSALSRKLGIPKSCFQSKFDNSDRGGTDGFIDAIRYLTHETDKALADGKYQYPDSIRTVSFDWEAEYNQYLENLSKTGRKNVSTLDLWKYDILENGKTLKQCREEDILLYADNKEKLAKLRLDYITFKAPLPLCRTNFYICGEGGDGKDTLSIGLARELLPGLSDDELFFYVSADGAGFLGYDGQPIIIWSDFDSKTLKAQLKGRRNVYSVFDTVPKNRQNNIKYGSVRLINQYNIVNSTQPYLEFLKDLCMKSGDEFDCDTPDDYKQSTRRFPYIIPIFPDYMEILINRGYLEDDSSHFIEYITYKRIRASFGDLGRKLRDTPEAKMICRKGTEPIVECCKALEDKKNHPITEETLREFDDFGKEIPIVPQKTPEEIEEERRLEWEKERVRMKEEYNKTFEDYLIPRYNKYFEPAFSDGVKEFIQIRDKWYYAIRTLRPNNEPSTIAPEDPGYIRWDEIPEDERHEHRYDKEYQGKLITDRFIGVDWSEETYSDAEISLD